MGWLFDYGDFDFISSLANIAAIAFIVSITFQTSMAKFTSKYKEEDALGKVNRIWKFSLKSTLLLGTGLFVLTACLSPVITGFLNRHETWYVVTFSSSLILLFALPANWGVLLGTKKFTDLGATHALWAGLKLVAAYVLVISGLGLYGALGAYFVAYVGAFIVTLFLLRHLRGSSNDDFDRKEVFSYTYQSFLAVLAFSILTNADVIMVTHYLHSEGASDYAMASVIAKIALYVPSAISVAMFPKSSDLFESGGNTRHLLKKALLLALVPLVVLVAIYWFASDFIINLLYGDKYPLAAQYIFPYGIAMGLFALCFVMMNYVLSLNRTSIRYPFLAAMVLELALIAALHNSIGQVVDIVLISAVATTVIVFSTYLVFRNRWERTEAPASAPHN